MFGNKKFAYAMDKIEMLNEKIESQANRIFTLEKNNEILEIKSRKCMMSIEEISQKLTDALAVIEELKKQGEAKKATTAKKTTAKKAE